MAEAAQTPTPSAPAGSSTPPTGAQPAAAPAGEAKPTPQTPPAGDVLDTTQPAGAQQAPAGDVLAGADGPVREGVPDQYSFEPPKDLPEGIALDEAKLDGFKATAKEAGLTQAQFQKLVEYDLERTQAATQEAVDAWNERVNGWRSAAQTDKDFGGENYTANVKTALQAVEKFGDAEFKALLQSPSEKNPEGLAIGNHPAVLRFLHRIGKMLGDPQLVQGDATAQAATDEAKLKRLYPSMFKESA